MRHGQRYSITSSFTTTRIVVMATTAASRQWPTKNSIMRSCQLCRKLGACQDFMPRTVNKNGTIGPDDTWSRVEYAAYTVMKKRLFA